MKVAIVAVGELARYLVEELRAQGHDVVAVSRSPKPWLDALSVPQRITDYSESSLTGALNDRDAAICTVKAGIPEFVAIHKALLAAAIASPRCKRVIPSFWAANTDNVTDERLQWGDDLMPTLEHFSAQSEIDWTAIAVGWFADYVVDPSNRYLGDIGEAWPQNHKDKTFILYKDSKQLVNFTAARDVARATAMLIGGDSSRWEKYTYTSAEQMSWASLFELLRSRDPEYKAREKSLAESEAQFKANEGEESVMTAMFEIWGNNDATHFDEAKVEKDRQRFFSGMRFRTLAELLDEAAANPGKAV